MRNAQLISQDKEVTLKQNLPTSKYPPEVPTCPIFAVGSKVLSQNGENTLTLDSKTFLNIILLYDAIKNISLT